MLPQIGLDKASDAVENLFSSYSQAIKVNIAPIGFSFGRSPHSLLKFRYSVTGGTVERS